jgi:LEA14-like dessication related protein
MAPLLPLIALLFGTKLIQAKKTGDALQYFPKNIELINGKIVATMEILNPTRHPLKIDSVFGNITANDSKVASIEQGTPFTLAPNARTSVTFPTKLNALGALKVLLHPLKLKKMKWKLVGVARALGIDTPISQDISFNA